MTVAIDIVSWLLILAGSFFIITGGIGLLRFPDFFTRLHAASVTDSLGAGLLIFGLVFQSGLNQNSLKLLLILILLALLSPTTSHTLAKAALHGKLNPFVKSQPHSPD